MKVQRKKHTRDTLQLYNQNFGLKAPYTVIVDGTFCLQAYQGKLLINEQFPKFMDAQVDVKTTSCAINECAAMEAVAESAPKASKNSTSYTDVKAATKILKTFPVVPCKHKKTSKQDAMRCLLRYAQAKGADKYIIGTTGDRFIGELVQIPGVPVVTIKVIDKNDDFNEGKKRKVGKLVLLNPSTATYNHIKSEAVKAAENDPQIASIREWKLRLGLVTETIVAVRKQKRKKGVNPLCMKKKQKSNGNQKKHKCSHDYTQTKPESLTKYQR